MSAPSREGANAHWFGALPGRWQIGRLGYLVDTLVPMRDKPPNLEGATPWVRIEDFDGKYISGSKSGQGVSREIITSMHLKVFPVGTVLCSCSCNMGATAIAGAPLVSNQTFIGLVPGRHVSSDYLYYLMAAAGPELQANATGAIQQYLSQSDFRRLRVPFPPLPTQKAIADYLDEKTAAIDALIEKKRKLLDLLAGERAALINQAVTKGLDPSVPMKDSGIPWIGEIPAHWELKRLKHLVVESVAGPYGSSLTKAMYTSDGYRVYGQQQVIPDDFSIGDYYISPELFHAMSRYQVFPGDLLVSVMGTIGKVAVVPEGVEPGIINPRLVRYRPDSRIVNVRYLHLVMLSSACQAPLLEAAQGSTMDGLNMGILGELRLAVPPVGEQLQIDNRVRVGAANIDQARNHISDQLSRLQEYRQALITAAVTGQLDIEAAA